MLVDTTGCLVGCSLLGSIAGGSFVGFLDGDGVIIRSSKAVFGRLLGLLDDVGGGGMSPLVCVCF